MAKSTACQRRRECGVHELSVNQHVIRSLLTRSTLPARQVVVHTPWVIERQNLQLREVQSAIAAAKAGPPLPRPENSKSQTLLFEQGSEV